jgi:NADPH:quinone reductase-like Zn-dependent oxidoreductase
LVVNIFGHSVVTCMCALFLVARILTKPAQNVCYSALKIIPHVSACRSKMGLCSSCAVASQHYATFCESLPDLTGLTIVITGTTSGTGLIAAKTVVAKGAHVIMLNRASERATAALKAVQEAADSSSTPGSVTQFECDLQRFASVRQAASAVLDTCKATGLDVLANNAGVCNDGVVPTRSACSKEMQT